MDEMPVEFLSSIFVRLLLTLFLRHRTNVLLVNLYDSRVPLLRIEIVDQLVDILGELLMQHCLLLELCPHLPKLLLCVLVIFLGTLKFLLAVVVILHGLLELLLQLEQLAFELVNLRLLWL
jgi:hypothetical protein